MRPCNGCAACCDLVPVKELGTRAFAGCPFKRQWYHTSGPGCGIYQSRPHACRSWFCLWARSSPNDIGEHLRPDRCGFVIDENLDLIKIDGVEWPAAQIWVMPGHERDFERDDNPSLAVIWSLCKGDAVTARSARKRKLAVLWRIPPGTHANAMIITDDGRLQISEPQPWRMAELGPDTERSRRVDELMR